MAKTADRARAHGIIAPEPSLRRVADGAVEVLDNGMAKVVVADEIASWVHNDARPDRTIDDYGDLAPPWPMCWIEYPSESGRQRRAVLFTDMTDVRSPTDNLAVQSMTAAKADAERNGFPIEDLRWLVVGLVFIEDAQHRVIGPVSSYTVALDAHGIMQGNSWMQFAQGGYEAEIEEQEWILAAIDPALTTISLTHMRNITVERVVPAIVRRHRKRDAKPPLRYYVLKLHLPRRQSGGKSGDGQGFASGIPVAGHRAHYGDCCPGTHPPKGKLFGKLTGVYWVPSFIRGSAEEGIVRTDIEVRHG